MFGWTTNALARLRRPNRRIWLPVAAATVTVTTATALVAFAPEPDHVPVADIAIPVTSMVAEPATHSPELQLYGRVETPQRARLTTLTTATVEAVRVREGDHIAKGDVLIELDATDARLVVRRTEADLVEARSDLEALKLAGADDREVFRHQDELHRLATEKLERYRRLRDLGSVTEELWKAVLEERHTRAIELSRQRRLVLGLEHRLAAAEARVDRALASLAGARTGVERTQITAPFPGRVTRIAVAPGELVRPGMVVADMYDDRRMQIRVHIPVAYLSALEKALQAGRRPAVLVDLADRRVSGALERMVGAVGEGQSGVDGLVRLDPTDATVDLGLTVGLRLTLPAEDNVLALPVQAVYGERRVFLIEGGLLVGTDVERVGRLTDEGGEQRLLVRAESFGARPRVLTSQLSNAVTGMRVRSEDA